MKRLGELKPGDIVFAFQNPCQILSPESKPVTIIIKRVFCNSANKMIITGLNSNGSDWHLTGDRRDLLDFLNLIDIEDAHHTKT